MFSLETGKFYWFRHDVENVWRVGYVFQDSDENQWLSVIGISEAWCVSEMNINVFDWVEIEQPEKENA